MARTQGHKERLRRIKQRERQDAKQHANDDGRETRILSSPIEFRADDDGGPGRIVGMASVFNRETVIGGGLFGFREQVAPGAFDGALSRPDDVRALFNHDSNVVLGRTASKTLRLRSTDDGLRYEVDLPDTSAARDVRSLVERGDITGSSFGFRVLDDEWDDSEVKTGKLPLRTITDVELFDVSPVTFPAYPQTSAEARSHAQQLIEAVRPTVPQPDLWDPTSETQTQYRKRIDAYIEAVKAAHSASRDIATSSDDDSIDDPLAKVKAELKAAKAYG